MKKKSNIIHIESKASEHDKISREKYHKCQNILNIRKIESVKYNYQQRKNLKLKDHTNDI